LTAWRLTWTAWRAVGVGAAGALLGLALPRLGPAALALPAAGVVAWLWLRPDVTLTFIFVSVVLLEGDVGGFFPHEKLLYQSVFRGMTVVDYLFLLMVGSVALQLVRERRAPLGAGPMSGALGALAAALVGAVLTAHATGISTKAFFPEVIKQLHIILIPFAVVEIVRARPEVLRILLYAALTLVAMKAAIGLTHVGAGRTANAQGQLTLTYLQPTPNWINDAFLIMVLAAALERVRMPWWVLPLVPLTALDLVFSLRRSFWIGTALGLAVVLILGSRRARLFVALGILTAAIALIVIETAPGNNATKTNSLASRALSLTPSRLSSNTEDRYRLDERRNILAEISRHPLTGLGLDVPWRDRYPLSINFPGSRTYVHFSFLYYWLNLGLLGALAYLALLATALAMAWQVWRREPDPLRRAFGLGMIGSLLMLAVTDTTSSFTADDYRLSLLEPIVLGILAAVWHGLGRRSSG
jgi:hypothetical protein